ncbi:TonB-dependent receptor, partial [bacterium]|nr:TonB-dependent receptor [bacterium]
MRIMIPSLATLLLPLTIALAAATLEGNVTDENGEALIGAEIVIQGTYRGGSTDLDGHFEVYNLPVGSHDIRVTMLGYTSVLETGVIFPPEGVVERSWALNSTVLAAGEDVVIIGARPLLDHDQTASATTISAADISSRVAENVVDIIQHSAGVVREKDEIHIRGGRAEENLYLIDDVGTRDPVTGEAGGTLISTEAIKSVEIMTGGFSAEYGQAQSGVIKVETRDGGTSLTGSFKYKRDYLTADYPNNTSYDVVEFTLGGPLPFSAQKLRYFLNGYLRLHDTFLPAAEELAPLPPFESLGLREDNSYSALCKLTWLPDPRLRLEFNYRPSVSIHQGYEKALMERRIYYPQEYEQILDNYNTFTDFTSQIAFTLKQTLNQRSFYEFSLGSNYFNRYSSPGNKEYWELEKPLDVDPVFYYYYPDGTVEAVIGDGYYEYGDGRYWHHHFSDINSVTGFLSSKITDSQLLKTGFEFRYTHIKLLDIEAPWVRSNSSLGTDFDMYEIYNSDAALYVTDHINFQGMIVDAGLRLDMWMPGKFAERAVGDTVRISYSDEQRERFLARTWNLFGYRSTAQLSPRLGVSHPITDNDMLFFSYGHFS